MPFCQANVEDCEAEEITCGCGVITCTLHGHIDEAYWEGCPNLVDEAEKGEVQPEIEFTEPKFYDQLEIERKLRETMESLSTESLVELFNYKRGEQVFFDGNYFIVKDPSQVKEQKELIQLLFEKSNFGPPAIIEILELVPTDKLQKHLEEEYLKKP